jgi:hypothetical protein
VHRRQPGGGAHIDAVVLADEEVAPLDQRHPHLAGEEDVLEIGRVVGARREQDDLRLAHVDRGDLVHRLMQARAVLVDVAQADVARQVREGAQHHVPVLDHVGDAGGRARIVLQHAELPVAAAHQIDAADMDVGIVRQIQTGHLRAVVLVLQDQLGRDDAVLEDLLLVINVAQEEVERLHPLPDAAVQHLPFRRPDQPRDDVEGQDAVDRLAFGIDREGDAEIEELFLRRLGPGGKVAGIQRLQPLLDRGGGGVGTLGIAEYFAEETVGIIAWQADLGADALVHGAPVAIESAGPRMKGRGPDISNSGRLGEPPEAWTGASAP